MGSGAPEPALSVPPSTDEIDNEWGSPKTNETQPTSARGPAKTAKGTLSGLSPLEGKSSSAPSKSNEPAPSQAPRGASAPSKAAPAAAETRRAPATAVAAPSAHRPRSGASLYLMGAGVIAAVGLWFAVRSSRSEPAIPAAPELRPPEPVVTAIPPAEPTAAAPAEIPTQPEAPAASALAAPANPAESAAAQPSVAASAAAAAAGESETIAILINIRPDGTQLFCKGRAMGKTPLTVEVPRGERRICEAVNPGFVTRKVVLDGSKSEISFAMKVEEPE